MSTAEDHRVLEKNVIEAAIKIAILGAMVVATLRIVQPFIMPLAWGVIIAVAVEPLIGKLAEKLGGRRKLVSTLFTLVVLPHSSYLR